MSKIRVAVVNSHPIQYFAPLYEYVNSNGPMEVVALYCSDVGLRDSVDPGFKTSVKWDVDLLKGYHSIFLGKRARARTPGGFFSLICPEIIMEIYRGKYDAIWLHGYGYAAYVLAALTAFILRIPILMRSETHLGLRRSRVRRLARDAILRFAYLRVAAFLSVGTQNRAYYRYLGIPDKKIFRVPYSVDNNRFRQRSSVAKADIVKLRFEYGIPADDVVVLFASKFMGRKNPMVVVQAAEMLVRQGLSFTLVLAGSGEQERELKEAVAAAKLTNVVFLGFINQSALPDVLGISDIFILPSEDEPWGLIVNEALCAGLPVIIGEQVGCAPDLVVDGENGFLVDPKNLSHVAEKMQHLIVHAQVRQRFSVESQRRISHFSYHDDLIGLRQALSFIDVLR